MKNKSANMIRKNCSIIYYRWDIPVSSILIEGADIFKSTT